MAKHTFLLHRQNDLGFACPRGEGDGCWRSPALSVIAGPMTARADSHADEENQG
jgi:hypothetical protein